MSDRVNEILDLLQEECGEVIVAISKIRRFGIDNAYKDGGSQREHLIQELGDVTLLIDLLKTHHVFSEIDLHEARLRKADKLRKWSTVYEQDDL